MMIVEVRPMTPEDERRYRELGGHGDLPVFVAGCDGVRAYGDHLDEVLARVRMGMAHRAALHGAAHGVSDSPSITTIQKRVGERFNVRVTDLRSARRDRATVHARHAAMYLCRALTPFSLPVIGRHFGRRDHTTVMYALRQVESRVARMPAVARALSDLADEITAELRDQAAPPASGPLQGPARDAALSQLAPMLKRRDALVAELELLNHQIEEIGQRVWGAAEGRKPG